MSIFQKKLKMYSVEEWHADTIWGSWAVTLTDNTSDFVIVCNSKKADDI